MSRADSGFGQREQAMPNSSGTTPGVAAGRLSAAAYQAHFADQPSPMSPHEAMVAADRCYFCHDAPCVTACPTAIDIPLFIRQISSGQPGAAGKTILEQNVLGGLCARACPTETLCEQACVRMAAEDDPVAIGRLQRHATDIVMESGEHPFERAADTGRRIAVVGAGPAGLACAHRLALLGNRATLFERREKLGGLNEYGIAAYKTANRFAAREVEWLLAIGGIDFRRGELGGDLSLAQLRESFDAVFLGVGLAGVNALAVDGVDLGHVDDAIGFIAGLRQAEDLASVPVGSRVVIVGGGMTAVDAAVQARLLGAESVTLAYRRGRDRMNASAYEQDRALRNGVRLLTDAHPVAIHGSGAVREVEFRVMSEGDGTAKSMRIEADQVLLAIGQRLQLESGALQVDRGRIVVDDRGRTGVAGVWAGGDCVAAGEDLTVTAVAQGRDAAEDIHRALQSGDMRKQEI